MKPIIRKISLVLFLSTIMMAGSMAQPGQGRGCGYGPGQGSGQGDQSFQCQNISNLTEAQQAELKSLRDSHFKVMKDFSNQMGEIKAKQKTVMSGNPIDEKAAGKLIDQKTELMNKQMKAQISHMAAMKKVFTAEQLLAMEQMQARKQFAQRKGKGPQGKKGNFGPQQRPSQVRK